MKLNERLRELRLCCGLTQEQVAQQLNVTRQTVSGYEAGRTEPGIDILRKMAEIYEVEIGDLVGCSESQHNISANLALERLKRLAKIAAAVFFALSLIGWVLMCGTNLFIPFDVENVALRIKMINASNLLMSSGAGLLQIFVIILCVLEIKDRLQVKVWTKLIWYGVILAGIYIISLPFHLLDSLYSYADYVMYPVLGLMGAFAVSIVGHIIAVTMKLKRKKRP